jgi:hypothetical protein
MHPRLFAHHQFQSTPVLSSQTGGRPWTMWLFFTKLFCLIVQIDLKMKMP